MGPTPWTGRLIKGAAGLALLSAVPLAVWLTPEPEMPGILDAPALALSAEDQDVAPPTGSMVRPCVDAFYAALRAGDARAMMTLWAPTDDDVMEVAGLPRARGRVAIEARLGQFMAAGEHQTQVSRVRMRTGLAKAEVALVEHGRAKTDAGLEGLEEVTRVATLVLVQGPLGWGVLAYRRLAETPVRP